MFIDENQWENWLQNIESSDEELGYEGYDNGYRLYNAGFLIAHYMHSELFGEIFAVDDKWYEKYKDEETVVRIGKEEWDVWIKELDNDGDVYPLCQGHYNVYDVRVNNETIAEYNNLKHSGETFVVNKEWYNKYQKEVK